MIYVWRILVILVVLEVAWAGWEVARTLSRPPVPNPDLSRLDETTASDLVALREGMDEGRGESWLELAEAYLAHGCLPESEQCFRRAARLDPKSGRILYGWASALDRLGQMEESSRRYQQAIPLLPEPQAQSSYYRIGRNDLRNENLAAADAALQRAGNLPQALYLRAKGKLRNEEPGEALRLLETLQGQMPETIESLRLRAECELAQGNSNQAARTLSRLERVNDRIDLNDQNLLLGITAARYGALRKLNQCSQLGDPGTAAECVLAVIPGHPQEYRYLPQAAELQRNVGRPEMALELLQRAVEQAGLTPELLEQIGDLHQILHRNNEAHAHWHQAVELGATATVHGKLAESCQARGDLPGTRRHAALQREAEGVAAYRGNSLDVAVAALQDAVAQNPAAARAWFYLGEAHAALGNDPPAIIAYQNCLKARPEHGRAHVALQRLPGVSAD
jgi:tetratricopeptide (TPR) repeat protein